MTRAVLLGAVAISLMAPIASADAASGQKQKQQQQKQQQQKQKMSAKPPPQPSVFPWAAPVDSRRRGPPWAMPNECYNDEGYGRWMPCAGRYD